MQVQNVKNANTSIIYKNILNNNFYFYGTSYNNYWNISKQAGKNIIGGLYLGGNFWASLDRAGFSQKCLDDDENGICDIPHTLDGNNSDYLPLAYKPKTNRVTMVLVEDTDFKFSDKCRIQKISRASNGSLLACLKAGGEKINVTFTGTAVSVISFGSPNGH